MTDAEILKIFTDSNAEMGAKLDKLSETVSEYKSDTNAHLSTLKEKVTQAEEKGKQLFKFHNDNQDKFSDLEKLIGENAHMVHEISGAVKSNKIGLDKSREEIRVLALAVAADDVKESTKKGIWKAVAATLTIVFIAIGTVITLLK